MILTHLSRFLQDLTVMHYNTHKQLTQAQHQSTLCCLWSLFHIKIKANNLFALASVIFFFKFSFDMYYYYIRSCYIDEYYYLNTQRVKQQHYPLSTNYKTEGFFFLFVIVILVKKTTLQNLLHCSKRDDTRGFDNKDDWNW